MSGLSGRHIARIGSARKKILIVAGEASGDLYGGLLIREVTRMSRGVVFFGVGGASMRKAGLYPLVRSEDITVVGLFEVIRHLGTIKKALGRVIASIDALVPDLVVLIDFPDFNFRVARAAKKAGVPVFYYISPQVWAWRRGRVKTLAGLVDKMVVIFPFEVDVYREAGVDVEFFGHPLMDVMSAAEHGPAARTRTGRVVALLPGSRKGEVRRHMPVMLGAARIIREAARDVSFVILLAPTLSRSDIEPYLPDGPAGTSVSRGEFLEVVRGADAAIVSSGTATVQTALAGTPMVVIYRLNELTYLLARLLVRVPYIAMVNLISQRKVVPELIQHEAAPERIARELLSILGDEAARKRMEEDLAEVRKRIGGPGASRRVAERIIGILGDEV
jgi:lipid-A-disaccharide synthase